MVPRRLLELEPLSEAPELAWHAYAVDYGLRVRSLGLRVCALDIPLTHNSITVNLDRLDEAYAAIAATHPGQLPVQTPGGVLTVGGPSACGSAASCTPTAGATAGCASRPPCTGSGAPAGGGACVLGDIRRDIDDVLGQRRPARPCGSSTSNTGSRFADERPGPLELPRHGRPIMLTSSSRSAAIDRSSARPPGASLLLTNLRRADLRALGPRLARPSPRLLGFRSEIGFWMLLGSGGDGGAPAVAVAQGATDRNAEVRRAARPLV